MINNSVKKCILCNNENIGEFIIINDKKYHLCCIEDLQKQNTELKEQQKEFIKFLEDEINKWRYNYDSYTYEYELEEPPAEELVEGILTKYKEIIEVE